jgi:hypothetical protein
MDGAGRARSVDLLRELVRQARAAEDDAWALAARTRERAASGTELSDALRVIELATATRVRLEEELRRAGTPGT